MSYSFNTKEELYTRVKPALSTKLQELKRLHYSNITELDIWNYLSDSKWSKSHGLMLSDIVNDIMHVDHKQLNSYVKNIKEVSYEKTTN